MNTENAKEFYKDLVFRIMEASEEHNIFTNYNNFSRDHFVFEKTFEECWKVMELIERDKNTAYAIRDMYAKKAYAKEPAMVAIAKQEQSKLNRWIVTLIRRYEKHMKANNLDYRHIIKEVSNEVQDQGE